MVDDDPDFCQLMSNVFGEIGYRVLVAADILTLETLLSTRKVDVAVVNLMLPQCGGLTACQVIREMVEPRVRVLLTASYIELANRAEVNKAADDVLVIPYYVEDIVERVERLCSSIS
jgi:two-component system response regulator VanR